jgi:predicted O-methyltransferase YrrM
MIKISLNNKVYSVNETDFPIYSNPGYETLILRPFLSILEREIGLINDISEMYNTHFINLGIRHGGYVPLELNVKSKSILNRKLNINDLHNFNQNIIEHQQNIELIDEIPEFNSEETYILRVDYSLIDLNEEDFKKITEKQNVIIIEHQHFKLNNLNGYLDMYQSYILNNSDTILHIPNNLNQKFREEFKYYFTDDGKFNYDNLINLCIMVKNAGNEFRQVLEKNLPYVDRWTFLDTGSTDNTIKIIKDVMKNKKGQLYCEPFINFRESRNRCLELAGKSCKYNIMLDDTYILQNDVRTFLNEIRSDQFATSYNIFINSGDITYGSNRITKSADGLRYIYKIHEIVQTENNKRVVQMPMNKCWIHDYNSSYMNERTRKRKESDVKLLQEEIEENPNDPRNLYYLAQTYVGIRDWKNAVKYFQKRFEHLVEGYREEITDSYLLTAYYGHTELNWEWTKCEKLYLKCFNHESSRPDALYFIASYYLQKDNYLAYQYLTRAFDLGIPTIVTSNLRTNLYNKILPETLIPLCYQFKDYQQGERAFIRLLNYVGEVKDQLFISYYKIFKLMNQNRKSTREIGSKPILTFVADGGFNKWQGSSLNKIGVGGSETYIIEMSRHIAKITDFDIYVFCNCETEELFDGVKYRKLDTYINFINQNKVHTSIISRFSEYIPVSLANDIDNIYLVVHDLLPSGNIIPTDSRLRAIFCMSEWHRSYFLNTYPMLSNKVKVFLNGINLIDYQSNVDKKLGSFIYSSFPNRGLIHLLKMFPKIRELLPDATLDIFCDLDGEFVQNVAKDEMNEIKKILLEQKEYVVNHGWTTKNVLQKYWQQAEFWLYPCTFMETFCITALEAAASGTLAITNNLAALENTVGDRGLVVQGDITNRWQNDVIDQLMKLIEDRGRMDQLLEKNQEWAEEYDWSKLGEKFVDQYIGNRVIIDIGTSEKKLSEISVVNMNRIALYHNTRIHHEMLGYLIEYCNLNNYEIDIYLIFDDENTKNWINYCNKFSKTSINWINSLKIIDNIDYNIIFLITDDNKYFSYIDQKYYHKIVSINHFYLNRRPELEHHICLRQFFNRPEIPYTIPTYNIILPEEKRLLLKNVSRIQVLFLGKFNMPSSQTFQLFNNFEDIDFHIIGKESNDKLFELLIKRPNMYFHSFMNIEELINLMKKSHFVFLMPAYIEGYPQHKLSSLIPLSYSTLCQPILPKMWNTHLKLRSILEYCDHKYLEPHKNIDLNISHFDIIIDNLYQERCELIEYNKNVLDNMIDKIDKNNNELNYFYMLNWSSDVPSGSKKVFESVLEIFKNKNCRILEIGTYVGTSVINMLKYLPDSNATVIDMWKNYDENTSLNQLEENGIEKIFYENLKKSAMENRINVLKGDSNHILKDLIEKREIYDLIYVDGSHKYLDCFNDMVSSWSLLSNYGVLAVDDYLWMPENRDNEKDRPYYAVNHFVEKYKDELEILLEGYRIFIQKRVIKIL